ncbi:MAG: hypothetical protein WC375_02940 [Methanomassiliicoccales archaeon]|jgi:ATP-dependent Zn protease
MTEDIESRTEKYIREMKKVAKEAQVDFEKGMKEVDRLGRMMFEDVKTELKDSGVNIKKVQETVKKDIDKEVPEIIAEMKDFQAKMENHLKELQEEIRKATK